MIPVSIISGSQQLKTGDLLFDSTLPPLPPRSPCLRIDHHVDGGWTMLDSLAKADWADLRTRDIRRLVTSYLDPDAIIAGTYLQHALETGDTTVLDSTHAALPWMYAAAYWGDHGVAVPGLDHDRNDLGARVELWLRRHYGALLGSEDRHDKSAAADTRRSAALQATVQLLLPSLANGRPPAVALALDPHQELEAMLQHYRPFVRTDVSTDQVGVLDITSSDRLGTPRAYYPLFRQPVVLRVIRPESGTSDAQYMLGVNMTAPHWEQLNLTLLQEALTLADSPWRPTGRRAVIGANSHLPLNDILGLLGDYDFQAFRDGYSPWSAYSWDEHK